MGMCKRDISDIGYDPWIGRRWKSKAAQVDDWVQAGKAVPKVDVASFTEYKG